MSACTMNTEEDDLADAMPYQVVRATQEVSLVLFQHGPDVQRPVGRHRVARLPGKVERLVSRQVASCKRCAHA